MYDYNRLVFLDNQKTGGTYVSKFLESCCSMPRVKYDLDMKHRPVRDRFCANATYFTTIREPFALYSSLFRYGQSRQGITWKHLKSLGHLSLYDSFPAWLEFVLDESNASIFDREYKRSANLGIGIMSFRCMRITVKHPVKEFAPAKSYNKLINIWDKNRITDLVFKQEDLNKDLEKLATKIVPQYFHQDKVREFLNKPERVNVTEVSTTLEFPPSLRKEIEAKEKFLIDRYYSTPLWKRIYERTITKFQATP